MANPLAQLYRDLHRHYGPQGWWPTTPPGQSRPRYRPGQLSPPKRDAELWEICTGALLTQNTAWRNVELALAALSEAGALCLEGAASLPLPRLEALIRPSGYYRQKARRLQHLARYIGAEYRGDIKALLGRPLAPLRRELLSLPGIGPETADCILLYAGGHPSFVIDAYTRRICDRLGLAEAAAPYQILQSLFCAALPAAPSTYNEYHALLVRHATDHCRSRPLCGQCPLAARCAYAPS